ncbi:hypothetical protein M0R19_04340 [Candidatus Pacearchaeota archaeon]|nr:hypothetical protein [Candidatus Pacearchaeota archaeon]
MDSYKELVDFIKEDRKIIRDDFKEIKENIKDINNKMDCMSIDIERSKIKIIELNDKQEETIPVVRSLYINSKLQETLKIKKENMYNIFKKICVGIMVGVITSGIIYLLAW